MEKNYNTPAYRHEKRLTSFVKPRLKKEVIKYATKHQLSISKAVEEILQDFFAV